MISEVRNIEVFALTVLIRPLLKGNSILYQWSKHYILLSQIDTKFIEKTVVISSLQFL